MSSLDATPTWERIDRELALPADESRELIRHHLAGLEEEYADELTDG